jgi:hypothetical protein
VHLGEAELVADLRLAQIEEVTERNHPPLARVEAACGRRDEGAGHTDVVEFLCLRCRDRLGLVVEARRRAEQRH